MQERHAAHQPRRARDPGNYAGHQRLGRSCFGDQQAQFFPALEIDFAPEWEFNFGVGVGTTRSPDHIIVKCVLGPRFCWPQPKTAAPNPAQP
jgi:hypothetical protein